jgi:aminodeoxychorismate synthase component I
VHRLHGRDDLGLPDAVWLLVDRVVAIEHASGRTFACTLGFGRDAASAEAHACENADWIAHALEAPPQATCDTPACPAPQRARDLDPADYAQAVETVLDEIRAGNVYQACLTARADRPFAGDPWALYEILRRLNPAPFASYLELPEVAIVGSSPERFLRVTRDGRVESRPIKGTAPRSDDPAEDAALREALRQSEKDRAENVMIVDLVRNDLGRVCETGSVAVPELLAIEAYASVFQLVSTVVGRLAPERDVLDAVRACFPAGSMTGAPKISAMKILDELEPVRRTVYAGALGYLDAWGGADLSVVIRTLLVRDGRAFVHAGGGVVADSKPEGEYAEALEKLRPLLAALDAAREPGSV